MSGIGKEGASFNFSSAGRAAHLTPDMNRVKRFDPYWQKYVRLTRIALGIGLLVLAGSIRLWTTDHGIWAGIALLVALMTLLGSYLLWQGASTRIYTSGLLIPAHITSLNPLQIVAMANMNNDADEDDETSDSDDSDPCYGLRRVTVVELPGHDLKVGERVPCVAAFGGSYNEGWGHFEPRPLVWGTDQMPLVTQAAEAIADEEWLALDELTHQLPEINDNQTAFYCSDESGTALRFIEAK